MTTEEFTTGLRAMADWYEAHPEAPVPHDVTIRVSCKDTKEEVARVARLLGSAEKEFGASTFSLIKKFGPLGLAFLFWRATVCERRVVGTRTIPAVAAQPEREEEIVEWDCHPLLAEEEAR